MANESLIGTWEIPNTKKNIKMYWWKWNYGFRKDSTKIWPNPWPKYWNYECWDYRLFANDSFEKSSMTRRFKVLTNSCHMKFVQKGNQLEKQGWKNEKISVFPWNWFFFEVFRKVSTRSRTIPWRCKFLKLDSWNN